MLSFLSKTSGVLLLLQCIASPSQAVEKSLSELKREAEEVLAKPDNVEQRKYIAPVFAYAERCLASGLTNEAAKYYTSGLQRYPWNLDAQLTLAALLQHAGKTNEARAKAELVFKYAETDPLLVSAASLLGQTLTTNLSQEPAPADRCTLVLVPLEETEAWLLREMRDGLEKTLKIPVVFKTLPSLHFPKPQRDPLHQKADDLRERIQNAQSDRQFQALLHHLNLSTNSLADDQQVFTFIEAILDSDTNSTERVKLFREELAFLRRSGPQWDAHEILSQLDTSLPARTDPNVAYLGVTKRDIFADKNRFLFGMAAQGHNFGVMSYYRYTATLYDEPPNRQRLKDRSLKQALSTTGLMFGLPRCTDPTCARAYADGLAEHDAKQLRLCDQCLSNFDHRFHTKKPE